MKASMSEKGSYIGIGAGMVLFAVNGLLPSSFIGGAIGVDIAKSMAGGSLEPSLLPRLLVGACMVFGVVIVGMFFLICTSSLGWLIGKIMDAAHFSRTVENE